MSTQRLSDAHILCRTYGHTWRPVNVIRTLDYRGQPIEYRAYLQCDRCETNRTQRLDKYGDIQGNSYRYAEGYAKHRDEESFTRGDTRREYLERLDNDHRIVDMEE